jgi:hypothetical protein
LSTDPAALPRVPDGRGERTHGSATAAPGPLAGLVEREAALVALSALYAVILLAVMPQMLVQDSWLALVSGREIVANGLPHTDTFTIWTQGVEWIDQQWLAQVAFYGLFALGGIELALLAHVGVLVVAFASGLAAARSLGASTRSVCLIGLLCMFVAPWGLQLRAQTLAMPLFVWLLWLLAADSRAPSRRVFLVLPILVLWANVHGTVVLAALLVVTRGLTYGIAELRKPARSAAWGRRTAMLTVLPFACLFASPYGLALVDYYRTMLVSPLMRTFVDEWSASLPSQKTMLFYVVAIAAAGLLARHRSRLSGFEQLALLMMLAAGASAIRSIVWFCLAALILLPRLLDGAFSQWSRRVGRTPKLALASAAFGAALVATGVVVAQPSAWSTRAWPATAAQRVADIAATRPAATVFADARYADWLLWEQPQLSGRIAYDIRFELLSRQQFEQLVAYQSRAGRDWRRAIDAHDVLVVDQSGQPELVRALRAGAAYEVAYRDSALAVLARER